MAKWRKKALIVNAQVLTQDCYITTLEGVSEGKRGDYLVTGVDNEQWVVKPKYFHPAYTRLHGTQYQRKPQVLEAVPIDSPEVSHAPTGDIKGDPGDYKVTGKKGESWYVKPDIFLKTYERVSKGMSTTPEDKEEEDIEQDVKEFKNALQKSIDQIGMDAVTKYLPKGMKLHPCDIHGHYLSHYSDKEPVCPLCIRHDPAAEGTTATDMEHWINIKDDVQAMTGYRPQG